jgi:hypothetical protein
MVDFPVLGFPIKATSGAFLPATPSATDCDSASVSVCIIQETSTSSFNAGYLGHGHDGANAVALTLPVTYALTDNIELSACASYQWEIDSDPTKHADDELLRNFCWGGVAVTVSF